MSIDEENEGNKKEPLKQTEAEIRKSLLMNEKGEYLVTYNLTLILRKSSDKLKNEKHDFEGLLEMTFNYHQKENLDTSNFFLNFVGEVHSLEINSSKITDYKFEKQRLFIPTTNLRNDAENKIIILFSGDYNHNGVGLHQYIDPSDKKEYLYTQFEPYDCNRLFPCFDQPDIKAILTLKVISPKEWIILANAPEKSITDLTNENQLSSYNFTEKDIKHLLKNHEIIQKNYHIYVFEDTPRISTYLFAVCAGPYYCIENKKDAPTKLRLFMRESLKNYGEPEEIFRVTIAGMEFYSNYFGCPYPFGKYDQIFCPEYNMGAMENVGLITYDEFYCWKDTPTKIYRVEFAVTILHELAHMWFGNMVTMKWWDNLWLNESFATFISHLCMFKSEELNKDYNTSWVLFADYKGNAYYEDQLSTTHPVMGEIKDTDEAETEFDGIVYEKGSSMVKQMYYYIGDEIFAKGLKIYFEKYKWGNTTFDDFIRKMVEASDNKIKDLNNLCDSWFKKAGLNEISLDMEIGAENKISKFVVKQKPCLENFPNLITHIVDILFIYDFNDLSKNKVLSRKVIEPKSETVFDFSDEVAPKIVFLNYNDWGYMKLDLDKSSVKSLKEGLVSFKDPLTKLSIYRSIFDAVRDSKISVIEFLDITLNALKYESNEDNLNSLLRYIHSVSTTYMPLKYIKEYSKKIFIELKFLFESLLSNINFERDLVKHILKYLPSYATEENDIKYLIQLMNLNPKLVSQEDRFRFLKPIFRCRTIKLEDKQKLLDEEVKRDNNSENSVAAKISCNALLPDRKNKELLWKKITTETTSDSLVNMKAIMEYFAPIDQYDLVEDFVKEKYFEVIPDLGKNNEWNYISIFVECCGPIHYANDETIKKFEVLIEKVKDMSHVKRFVEEECDIIKRKRKAVILCEQYLKSIGDK